MTIDIVRCISAVIGGIIGKLVYDYFRNLHYDRLLDEAIKEYIKKSKEEKNDK